MRVIIDSNLVAALVLPLAYSEQAAERIASWKRDGTELLAPALLEYEVTSVLRKAVVAGWLTTGLAIEALLQIDRLNLQFVLPTAHLHERALHWADNLGQSQAYDAQYLALAEREGLTFWTAGRRLANEAKQAGIHWVRWIGDAGEEGK